MTTNSTPWAVHLLTASLLALGVVTGVLAAGPVADWWLLVPLGVALVVGESLQVQFKYGRDLRAVDVFEAVLAPVLLTFAGPAAVGLAVVSKAISQRQLHVARTKAMFNVAQWAGAVGVASLVYRTLAGEEVGTTSSLLALVAGLLAFAVTNEIAMALVLRLVNPVSMRQVLRDLAPEYIPHALMWGVNAALGVLFAAAVATAPATSFLLLAPLAFLRWSHQAYLAARTDRSRLDGLARAVSHLAAPIDPKDALPTFLDDLRLSFGSGTVELVLFEPGTVLRSGVAPPEESTVDLARLLVAGGTVHRARSTGKEATVAAALLAAGHRDALAAPLARDGQTIGALVSYDHQGHEGFEDGEEAVMAALADAASRAIEKSALLGVIVDERRQLAEIVDRSSDGIFTIGADGTVDSWNPAMEHMTGVAAGDIVGVNGMVQFAPRDTAGNQVRFDRWREDGIPAELLITTTTGERWLGCSSAVGGGGNTLVIVARDITRAREIDQMKDDFIATVSHELRTPLATIRGFTEVLEPPAKVSDEMLSQVLGRIRKGTHRLERLVANLLEVSRMEARRSVDLVPAELDLGEIVRRVVDEVQESWPDRSIEIDLGGSPWRVHGNLLSLERILINLLSNALTYADSGPVLLRVRAEADDVVAVSVRDHGPGIPARDQERIFERFERADTERQKAGTGLGLYIARGLARSMDAELVVQSEVGEGAEFTLNLHAPTTRRRPQLVDLVC
ncbi:MAG: sensor histidine kinase [Acidimicrobiales bacterium]